VNDPDPRNEHLAGCLFFVAAAAIVVLIVVLANA
jgi:hypothetical protein